MSGNEVVALLAYMSSAWPSYEITEDTARLWSKQLISQHAEDALAAADDLIRSSKFFPSVAELLEGVKTHARRRVELERAAKTRAKELEEGIASRKERKEHARQALAAIREVVANTTPPYKRRRL